jgi:predicted ATPase
MKVVITGGPCSGKSTLINELKKRGYNCMDEVARRVIEERKSYEPTKSEWDIRQRMILERQVEGESQLESDLAFLDRGLIDNYAYFIHRDGKVPENIDFRRDYGSIFVLDRLPFKNDGLRAEDDKEAGRVHDLLIGAYRTFGYDPIRVPVSSVEERADYVLTNIYELKGGRK